MKCKYSQVAAGIIRNERCEIFLTQRIVGAHLEGYWEFPGGKVESGETPEVTLRRELYEETGIQITHYQLLETLDYIYPDRSLTLHFFLVDSWQGHPCGREGQLMRWVAQKALNGIEFPVANRQVIDKLLAM